MTTIGSSAFYSCDSLSSVVIGDSVTTIGDYAFHSCGSLSSVVIPDSVTTIGSNAFYDCDGLTSVVIPDGVTSIGDYAFLDCSSLTEVVIPNSVTSIGYHSFFECSSLEKITIPFIGTKADGSGYTQLIDVFGYSLFPQYGVITSPLSLKTVVLTGGNVVSNSFYNCLTIIEIVNKTSNSITIDDVIESGATYVIEIHEGESKIVNQDGYFFYTYNGTNYLVGYSGDDTDLVLPQKYNGKNYVIYDDAFYYRSSLTSVVIPDSVTTIGSYAFYHCDSLTDVYYTGSETEWQAITIDSGNYDLTNATIHYNYVPEN